MTKKLQIVTGDISRDVCAYIALLDTGKPASVQLTRLQLLSRTYGLAALDVEYGKQIRARAKRAVLKLVINN